MWVVIASRASAVITGPTSTESLRGVADLDLRHRAFQHVEDAVGDVVLQAEDAQGRAALASRIERRRNDVGDDLFGERRGIDDHRVEAAGFGDEGEGRAAAGEAPGEFPFNQSRNRGRAREDHTLNARVGDQRRADVACPGHELQPVARYACLVHEPHGFGGHERRLFCGLRDHRVARGQRGGDLAGEDRERKVPRTDADDQPERGRGAGQERARRLVGVVTQEVDRFAHFGDRIGV